jgi:hypothetical protein
MEAYLSSQRVTPVDPIQERLTRTEIIPYLSLIIFDFQRLREAIDMAVNQFSILQHGDSLENLHLPSIDAPQTFYGPMLQSSVNSLLKRWSPDKLAQYPIGQCTTITKLAWNLLTKATFLPQTDGFRRLQFFVSAGGIFQTIWGGCRHRYFQTAFQAGEYYIDISNDTVDLHKPQIDHALLGESGFYSIQSYQEYMEIKVDYHQAVPFINNCFPRVFAYFPSFVRLKAEGAIAVDTNLYMARLNVATRFRTVFDALDAGLLGSPLDRDILQQIRASVDSMSGNHKDRDLLAFRIVDRDEMIRLLRDAASLDPSEHVERLKRADKLCRFLNYVWAKSQYPLEAVTTQGVSRGGMPPE